MTPIKAYEDVWSRCDHLSHLHAYLHNQVTPVISLEEMLRSEWAMRVSALDLFVHETVAQGMREIFEGTRPTSQAFARFQLPNETVSRIRSAATQADAASAFDLEVRSQLSIKTYQDPEHIAKGIRLCSDVELWNEVAARLGAVTPAQRSEKAKLIKRDLSLIVQRRNKIVHEGDLQPQIPREPWPIAISHVSLVATRINEIVRAINSIV